MSKKIKARDIIFQAVKRIKQTEKAIEDFNKACQDVAELFEAPLIMDRPPFHFNCRSSDIMFENEPQLKVMEYENGHSYMREMIVINKKEKDKKLKEEICKPGTRKLR